MSRKGYLSVQVQSLKVFLQEEEKDEPVVLEIKLGELETKSEPQMPSSPNWTQSYLLEVMDGVGRIGFKLSKGEGLVGECRFDIEPIMIHENMASILDTDMMDEDGKAHAHIALRITYYSAKYGKIAIKVHDVTLTQALAAKTKTISVRFKLGPIIKTTKIYPYPGKWDETVNLIVLSPVANLVVGVICEGQVIGENSIFNLDKSGFLKGKKDTESNVFWEEKHSGKVKYEIEHYREQ